MWICEHQVYGSKLYFSDLTTHLNRFESNSCFQKSMFFAFKEKNTFKLSFQTKLVYHFLKCAITIMVFTSWFQKDKFHGRIKRFRVLEQPFNDSSQSYVQFWDVIVMSCYL